MWNKKWVVEWRDEWGLLNCKKFDTEKEANKFADEIFVHYAVRIYKELYELLYL